MAGPGRLHVLFSHCCVSVHTQAWTTTSTWTTTKECATSLTCKSWTTDCQWVPLNIQYNLPLHKTVLFSWAALGSDDFVLYFFSIVALPLLHKKNCHPRSRLTLKWKWTLVHLQEVLFTETASFPLPKYEESYKVCSNVEPEVTATAATWLFFFVMFFLHFFY